MIRQTIVTFSSPHDYETELFEIQKKFGIRSKSAAIRAAIEALHTLVSVAEYDATLTVEQGGLQVKIQLFRK